MTFSKAKGFKPKSFWEKPKGIGWNAKSREQERREERGKERRWKVDSKEQESGEQSSKELLKLKLFIIAVLKSIYSIENF